MVAHCAQYVRVFRLGPRAWKAVQAEASFRKTGGVRRCGSTVRTNWPPRGRLDAEVLLDTTGEVAGRHISPIVGTVEDTPEGAAN